MADFTVNKSEKGEMIMGGSLTIENASEIRRILIKTLIKEDQLEVCIGPDASMDVSFLQLLCSAHFTASKISKTFSLRPLSVGNFFRAVENAGYARSRGCSRGSDGGCLWIRGEYE